MKSDRTKWETRYRAGDRPHDGPPSGLLRRWLPVPVLPNAKAPRRLALDVATGLGRNALQLARAGYRVDAVDISPTALRAAARRARREGLRGIRWILADLDRWRPSRGQYDVVVNAFFLDRRLFPALRAAVRPGGILIFETHLAARDRSAERRSPRGRRGAGRRHGLRRGELRRALRGWELIYAKDGRCREGGRMLALGRIVARRPAMRALRPQTKDRSGSSPASSR